MNNAAKPTTQTLYDFGSIDKFDAGGEIFEECITFN